MGRASNKVGFEPRTLMAKATLLPSPLPGKQWAVGGPLFPPALALTPAFSLPQSSLGFVALVLSTLHTLTYGWTRAFEESHYKFYLPPTFTLTLLVPCLVILAKALFLLPCVSRRLARIRRGWEKDSAVKFTLPVDHALGQKTSHL